MRVKAVGKSAVYHCVSRIVGAAHLIDELGKEVLRKQIRYMADFCGVQVLAYCVMSNHFHVLVRVPGKQEVSDEELIRRFSLLYKKQDQVVKTVAAKIQAGGEEAEALRTQLLARMGDVSTYMKELKQRFSIWYNRSHKRCGTLWQERFKSVLIEENHSSLPTVAAYIDLNPVRAGMVKDPKDYRFSSYGEVMAGSRYFKHALGHLLESNDLGWAGREYRKLLYLFGATQHRESQKRMDRETVLQVIQAGGKVSLAELLRLRVRYFSDGLVLGSRAYVDEFFKENRFLFGQKRKDGARKLRHCEGLFSARDLRKAVLS